MIMECPNCTGYIDPTLMNIETSAEEDGIEVNFKCPWCKIEHYAVLNSENFSEVD